MWVAIRRVDKRRQSEEFSPSIGLGHRHYGGFSYFWMSKRGSLQLRGASSVLPRLGAGVCRLRGGPYGRGMAEKDVPEW